MAITLLQLYDQDVQIDSLEKEIPKLLFHIQNIARLYHTLPQLSR